MELTLYSTYQLVDTLAEKGLITYIDKYLHHIYSTVYRYFMIFLREKINFVMPLTIFMFFFSFPFFNKGKNYQIISGEIFLKTNTIFYAWKKSVFLKKNSDTTLIRMKIAGEINIKVGNSQFNIHTSHKLQENKFCKCKIKVLVQQFLTWSMQQTGCE